MNDYLRVYTNSDLIGVELWWRLKNVIAVASGVIAGMGLVTMPKQPYDSWSRRN